MRKQICFGAMLLLLGISSVAQAWDRGDSRRPWGPPRPPGGEDFRRPPRVDYDPVYRFFDGRNHFQTLNYQEGVNARMSYEGISFYVMRQAQPGSVALFRCYSPASGDHMVSADPNCEQSPYRNEGLYGWVQSGPGFAATLPIYRCYHEGSSDHLTTKDPGECQRAGYRVEPIQGFVAN